MNRELIEKLKVNEKPIRLLCDMTDEEQAFLNNMVSLGVIQFMDSDLRWYKRLGDSMLSPGGRYRIDPDFQPEPEYEDCPIKANSNGNLCYERRGDSFLIFRATTDSQFLCYIADGQSIGRCPGNVPSPYRDRMKCAVRFLKEKS